MTIQRERKNQLLQKAALLDKNTDVLSGRDSVECYEAAQAASTNEERRGLEVLAGVLALLIFIPNKVIAPIFIWAVKHVTGSSSDTRAAEAELYLRNAGLRHYQNMKGAETFSDTIE